MKGEEKEKENIPVKIKIKVWLVDFEINKNAHLQ